MTVNTVRSFHSGPPSGLSTKTPPPPPSDIGKGPRCVTFDKMMLIGIVHSSPLSASQLAVDSLCKVKVTADRLVKAKNGWMKVWLTSDRSASDASAKDHR